MIKPVLIVMAAGMGSRYGGLKQMEAVGSDGEIIIDFSLYDAYRAGFEDIICVIKQENLQDFQKIIDEKAGKYLNINYAFQKINDLPTGYDVPEGREKPWGTCHAVLSCRDLVKGPFAVINADDYYGPESFKKMYDYLQGAKDDSMYRYAMIGYGIANTLTENGTVARGVCSVSSENLLEEITERTKIKRDEKGKIVYGNEDETVWEELPEKADVSMNFWGFTMSMMKELEKGFHDFIQTKVSENPMKAEYFLPLAVDELIQGEKATVKVIKTEDKWYGVTYREDREYVIKALQSLKDKGLYPEKLWVDKTTK